MASVAFNNPLRHGARPDAHRCSSNTAHSAPPSHTLVAPHHLSSSTLRETAPLRGLGSLRKE